MVYGRYNYSIHGVYKPTDITGGHHPVLNFIQFGINLINHDYGNESQNVNGIELCGLNFGFITW